MFRVSIAAGFAGWMLYLVSVLLQHHTGIVHQSPQQLGLGTSQHPHSSQTLSFTFLTVAGAIAVFLLGTTSPLTHIHMHNHLTTLFLGLSR